MSEQATSLTAETIDVTVTVRTRWVVEKDTPENRQACVDAIRHYFSKDAEAELFGDFGYQAWGGYDGPRVIEAVVLEESSNLSSRGD